jgi:hypothetical protein
VVRDHSGQALAYVYFEEEPGRRRPQSCSRGGRGQYRIEFIFASFAVNAR